MGRCLRRRDYDNTHEVRQIDTGLTTERYRAEYATVFGIPFETLQHNPRRNRSTRHDPPGPGPDEPLQIPHHVPVLRRLQCAHRRRRRLSRHRVRHAVPVRHGAGAGTRRVGRARSDRRRARRHGTAGGRTVPTLAGSTLADEARRRHARSGRDRRAGLAADTPVRIAPAGGRRNG